MSRRWLEAHRKLVRLAIIVSALVVAGVVMAYRASVLFQPEPPAFPTGVVRVAVDPSIPPFAYYDQSGELVGLDVDLARRIAEELAMPVDLQIYGVDGLYDALYNGNVDLVIAALQPETWRMGDALYTRSYFDNGLVLVVLLDSEISAMSHLPENTLAYAFASDADTEARRWSRRIEAFEHQPYELASYAIDAVRLQQADAALVDAISARLYLRDHPQWQAKTAYVTHQPLVIAVNREQPATFRVVNAALTQLIENGTVEKLLERWL